MRDVGGRGERGEMYTRFCWGNLRKIYQLENPGVEGIVVFRSIFRNLNVSAWNGSSWLRIRTVGGYFRKR